MGKRTLVIAAVIVAAAHVASAANYTTGTVSGKSGTSSFSFQSFSSSTSIGGATTGSAISAFPPNRFDFNRFGWDDPTERKTLDQRIRDAGGSPFAQATLPEAILALKQGVGRLIRSETDRGVMAILDSRINSKRYGPQIVASLPPAGRTRRFQDVQEFFSESKHCVGREAPVARTVS